MHIWLMQKNLQQNGEDTRLEILFKRCKKLDESIKNILESRRGTVQNTFITSVYISKIRYKFISSLFCMWHVQNNNN